jgi:hypothetical protein
MNRDEPLTPEERELARLLGRRAEQAPPAALDATILAAARAAVDAPAADAVPRRGTHAAHTSALAGGVRHRRLDGVRHRHRLAAAPGTAAGSGRRGRCCCGARCGRRRAADQAAGAVQPTARLPHETATDLQPEAAPVAAPPAPSVARAKPAPAEDC